MIRAMVKEPGKPAEVKHIEDTLESYQQIVGGYIETVRMGAGILMVCNEEGKMMGLEANMFWHGDIIVGTIIFVKDDGEKFGSLDKKQIEKLKMLTDFYGLGGAE